MAKRNYREIQQEYLRRVAFAGKRPFQEYHRPEPVAEKLARLSRMAESGCREWLGKIGTHGYAYIDYRVGHRRFHRKAATVAYELRNGPVPKGKEVSHSCDNRKCVNPDHLLAETHSENITRRAPYRWGLRCKHCKAEKEQADWKRREWTCRDCNARRAKEWRERTGYDYNNYYAANKDRINAQRRLRRSKAKP